jgi:hypothetical protein
VAEKLVRAVDEMNFQRDAPEKASIKLSLGNCKNWTASLPPRSRTNTRLFEPNLEEMRAGGTSSDAAKALILDKPATGDQRDGGILESRV